MKMIRAIQRAIFNFFFPDFQINPDAPSSERLSSDDILNEWGLEDNVDDYDSDLDGWTQLHHNPLLDSEDNDGQDRGGHVRLSG